MFREYLNILSITYLNNIIIYSQNPAKYKKYIRLILTALLIIIIIIHTRCSTLWAYTGNYLFGYTGEPFKEKTCNFFAP